MIKITFKESQVFLANENQGGCFTAKEITLNSLEIFKNDSYFRYRGLDFKILTNCIKSINPVEIMVNEFHTETIDCVIHSFPMNDDGVCFKCGSNKPERPKTSPIMHERMTQKELKNINNKNQ